MSARLPATFVCLLSFGLCIGRAETVAPSDRTLVVSLKTDPHQAAEPVREMQREVSTLMRSVGYDVEWRKASAQAAPVSGSLIVLELRGVCQAPARPADIAPLAKATSLASSAVVDGAVLPFSWIDCGTLTRFVAPSLVREPGSKLDHLYGRAMGRLAAHEFMHVLSGRVDHDDAGIGKPYFSAKDVLAEQFTFETASVAASPAAFVASQSEPDTADTEESFGR